MTALRPRLLALVFVALAPAAAPAQDVFVYSFTGGVTTPTSGSASYISAMGAFTGGATGNASPLSSGYTGASGGHAYGRTAVDSASFFSVTITPNTSGPISGFALSDFDVGVNSTSSGGAQSFALRSSVDGFATNLWTASVTADGVWRLIDGTFAIRFYETVNPVELRLYASNPLNLPELSQQNTRIDDVRITLYAVPEPATVLGVAAAALGLGRAVRRRRAKAA